MMDWFNSLESRERLFVSGGAVIVVVALAWAMIWLPLERGHQSRAESVDTWQRALSQLAPLTSQPASSADSPTPVRGTSQTPVVIIDQTLRSRGLDNSLKRSQPTTSTGIRVEFENVAFDDLVVWMGDLSSNYGMDVQAGSFQATTRSAPGRVNASLTLEKRN